MQLFNKPFGIAFSAAFVFALAMALSGVAKAADNNTITLGAIVSLTGAYSASGQFARDGYKLAVERINSSGGIQVGDKTYKLAVKYYDDRSVPTRSARLAKRLIKDDGVRFFLGPSALAKAVAPITEKHKVPMVEGNSAMTKQFEQGYKYLFAVLDTPDMYLTPAVKLAAEQAKAAGQDPSSLTLAIATATDDFSQDVRQGVLATAKKYGMKVVIDKTLLPGFQPLTAMLTKVKTLEPDLLLVSSHAYGAPMAVSQVSDMPVYKPAHPGMGVGLEAVNEAAAHHVYVPMLALTHCKAGRIIKRYGAKANYALCAAQWDASLRYAGRWFKTAQTFADASEQKYGYITYQVAESAAAVVVMATAFERAGSLDPGAVRNALAKTDMTTFYGPVHFDGTGKNTAKPMVMYQVLDQQYEVIAPPQQASAKFVYPAPKWSAR